jgi:flagellar biosynthesis/type III secretory pathway protein FliH
MGKTMAQELIEEGMKAGLKQGLQQGKIEGKIEGLQEAISLGLEIRYGNDGLALLENIVKINSIEKLEEIMSALKVSKKVDDIKKLI